MRTGEGFLAAVLVAALVATGLPLEPPAAHAEGVVLGSTTGSPSTSTTAATSIQGWDLPRVPVEIIRAVLKRVIQLLEDMLDHWTPGDPPSPPPGPED